MAGIFNASREVVLQPGMHCIMSPFFLFYLYTNIRGSDTFELLPNIHIIFSISLLRGVLISLSILEGLLFGLSDLWQVYFTLASVSYHSCLLEARSFQLILHHWKDKSYFLLLVARSKEDVTVRILFDKIEYFAYVCITHYDWMK